MSFFEEANGLEFYPVNYGKFRTCVCDAQLTATPGVSKFLQVKFTKPILSCARILLSAILAL